jgi:predicted ATPase/DNA-binding CsgD family transcriptional regulator
VLRRATKGTGAVFVIEGEAGIGKTRLLSEIADKARSDGFEVFVGRGEELERSEMVLGGRAPSRPVLFGIEDLHWADAATLSSVREAARRTRDAPVFLIVTSRPPHGLPHVAHVVDRMMSEGAGLMVLEGLDEPSVATVVGEAIHAKPGPALLAEVGRAAGNPFYVLELVSALDAEGVIVRGNGIAELEGAGMPPSLRNTILRRLAMLPIDSLEDLRTAAVLGSSFTLDDLSLATGRSGIDLLRSLAPALAQGVIRDAGERLAFQHDLVRGALYDDMPLSLRGVIHRRIARAFEGAGRSPRDVATHLVTVVATPSAPDVCTIQSSKPRRRATIGWDALTPSELRIVDHVARGMTNAAIGDVLFISRRTVQTHLRNVFVKLNVSSRAEVAAEAVRRSG